MLIYNAARTIGGLLLFAGSLSLISHLADQFQIGLAPSETLIGGGAALMSGFLMCLLGGIGRRVVRLEEQLAANRRVDPDRQNENDILQSER